MLTVCESYQRRERKTQEIMADRLRTAFTDDSEGEVQHGEDQRIRGRSGHLAAVRSGSDRVHLGREASHDQC